MMSARPKGPRAGRGIWRGGQRAVSPPATESEGHCNLSWYRTNFNVVHFLGFELCIRNSVKWQWHFRPMKGSKSRVCLAYPASHVLHYRVARPWNETSWERKVHKPVRSGWPVLWSRIRDRVADWLWSRLCSYWLAWSLTSLGYTRLWSRRPCPNYVNDQPNPNSSIVEGIQSFLLKT